MQRLSVRLLATHLIVAVVALVIGALFTTNLIERRALEDLEDRLDAESRSVRSVIAGTGIDQTLITAMGRASGTRVTVIRSNGVVVADSERDPASMDDHATRPEIVAALSGRTGVSQRTSDTVGSPFLYVAPPVQDGIIVRTALPADEIAQRRSALRGSTGLALLVSGLVAAIMSVAVASGVSRPLRRMSSEVARVADGSREAVQVAGPLETRTLAAAVNRMAAELAQRMHEVSRESDLRDQILAGMDEGVVLADRASVVFANRAAHDMVLAEAGSALPPALAGSAGGTERRDVSVHHPTRRDLAVVTLSLDADRTLYLVRDVTREKQIEAMRRDFVANASHEMKTPVAGILATAETLRGAIADDPVRATGFADKLAGEATRLSSLITDLLSLARLEEAQDDEMLVPLSAVVTQSCERARARCRERSIELVTSIAPDVTLPGNEASLMQMVDNLLDNAIRHTPPEGRIEVRLEKGTDARLVVADTGEGIPSKDLPRIFERFFRVDPARARTTGGTGLGLAIVRHIAERHGGRVEARSELGRGSTFTVSLPLA